MKPTSCQMKPTSCQDESRANLSQARPSRCSSLMSSSPSVFLSLRAQLRLAGPNVTFFVPVDPGLPIWADFTPPRQTTAILPSGAAAAAVESNFSWTPICQQARSAPFSRGHRETVIYICQQARNAPLSRGPRPQRGCYIYLPAGTQCATQQGARPQRDCYIYLPAGTQCAIQQRPRPSRLSCPILPLFRVRSSSILSDPPSFFLDTRRQQARLPARWRKCACARLSVSATGGF